MGNGVKTVLLLGALSGLLLVIGELLGGANGLMMAFVFARQGWLFKLGAAGWPVLRHVEHEAEERGAE